MNVDFNFIYEEVKETYGEKGNVSVTPPVILKLMLLLILYNVKTERELMLTLAERLDWIWFLGSLKGTVMVKDINPSGNSWPKYFINVNGTLFFNPDDGTNSEELWKSDGTAEGTVMIKDQYEGINNGFMTDL